tara:strand:+ start:300 stop:995 length:696 start_codon:yes stop_codon:yes gene_type:complete
MVVITISAQELQRIFSCNDRKLPDICKPDRHYQIDIPCEDARRLFSLAPHNSFLCDVWEKALQLQNFSSRPFSFAGASNRYKQSFVSDLHKHTRRCCNIIVCLDRQFCDKIQAQHVQKNRKKHCEVGCDLGFVPLDRTGTRYLLKLQGKFLYGSRDKCDVPPGRAGMHTHPLREYAHKKVVYAWPSFDDYTSIREKMLDNRENCILHLVATKEGIYLICMNREMLEKFQEL